MTQYGETMKLLEEGMENKDGLIMLSTIALEPEAHGRSCPPAL